MFPAWTYYVVSSGQELMVVLESSVPMSVILLDVHLPGKDGISILKEIRRLPAYQSLPVVCFSNVSSRSTVDSLLMGGAKAFFQKPISSEAMIGFLQRLPAFSN